MAAIGLPPDPWMNVARRSQVLCFYLEYVYIFIIIIFWPLLDL